MVVQERRLDWVGNFNWLLQQDLNEFFCYRQHDDTTAPEFFEVLLEAADKNPGAAAIYCDCKWSGESDRIEIVHSIRGEPRERIFEFVERIPQIHGPPIRGLFRTEAIRQAGPVRSDEFRACWQIHSWLAKLLRWGDFERVGSALYYRVDHSDSFTRQSLAAVDDRKSAAWTTVFTGLLEAAIPLCKGALDRRFFQDLIIGRTIAFPSFYRTDTEFSFPLVCESLARLEVEGNSHLVCGEEVPLVMTAARPRFDEIMRARQSRLSGAMYHVRQRVRLAAVLYPETRARRLAYCARHVFRTLKDSG